MKSENKIFFIGFFSSLMAGFTLYAIFRDKKVLKT